MTRLVASRCGIALASVALVGCQTAAQTSSLQCGAGGAAGAYLLCKAMHGSDAECLGAATVVGVGGAAICYSYAANLERRKKELAGRENDLDARIKYVRGLNQDSRQLNTELGKRLAETTRATDDLVAQIRQNKVSGVQLAQARDARDKEVRAASAQAARSTEALAEAKAYRARARPASPDLDADLARQEQLNAETQRLVAMLAAQKSRV